VRRRIVAGKRDSLFAKSYILIPFVLLCAGVAAAALAPLMKVPADSVYSWISRSDKDVPIRRVFARLATVFAIVLLIVFRKHLKSNVKASINPKQNPPGKPFISGFLVGLVALLLVAVVIAVLGGGDFKNPHALSADFWNAFGAALGPALLIAFFEEIFFRGIVFQGLRADIGTGLAAIIAAAFFSLVHFMGYIKLPDISGSDPLGGFKVLAHSFDRFADFDAILPFAVGLFLIGILLTVAYLKTSALFLPMGFHASLVFFSKFDHLFFEYGKKASSPLFGSSKPDPEFLRGVDALLTWIMVVVLTIVVALFGHKLQSGGREVSHRAKASAW
jgi:membrane protease YdiL (CAAX protease family)